jgi:hypothetical protein
MNRRLCAWGLTLTMMALASFCEAQDAQHGTSASAPYLGFDRNDYPGDAALAALRTTFRYTGYWLNNPPGEVNDTWIGKRAIVLSNGFGFLVLFNGRLDAQLRRRDAAALGTADGKAAAAAAAREGFPQNVIIFLDQEEGGRLLPEQDAYLFAWIDAVRSAGARAGVYCSGIDVPEGKGTINTARDIVEQETARAQSATKGKESEGSLFLWIANDQCPPAPGCTLAAPSLAGVSAPPIADFVRVWQYAQSPFRPEFSASCRARAARDGNCYAPDPKIFVDLNTAGSPDPSEGAQ